MSMPASANGAEAPSINLDRATCEVMETPPWWYLNGSGSASSLREADGHGMAEETRTLDDQFGKADLVAPARRQVIRHLMLGRPAPLLRHTFVSLFLCLRLLSRRRPALGLLGRFRCGDSSFRPRCAQSSPRPRPCSELHFFSFSTGVGAGAVVALAWEPARYFPGPSGRGSSRSRWLR